MTGFWKRPRRLNYAVNQKRVKNNNKVQNAVNHYETLKKRITKEWDTKWLINAVSIVQKKLKKYQIKFN